MRNLAQAVTHLHFELMGLRENARSFYCATERRCIDGRDFFVRQTSSQPTGLLPPLVGKLHICGPGKTIFRGENGRAVSYEKNTGSD